MMKITRRNLLLYSGINIPAMVAGASFSYAESPFKSFQLILSDITTATPAAALLAILEPFVAARVPVCCIVRPQSETGTLLPDSDLADYLRRFISDYPDQIEVAVETAALTGRPYYFQARQATRARQSLIEGLVVSRSDQNLVRSVLTLASFGRPMSYEPGGIRAAGFRTALSLPRTGIEPVDSRWDSGVLHLFGGMHFVLAEPFDRIERAVTASVRDDPRTLLNISVEGLTSENTDAAVAKMNDIVSLVSALAEEGQIVATTPTEFRVRASPNPDTLIGLRLDVPGKPDEPISASALELAQWLRAQEYGFTVAGEDAPSWQDDFIDICPAEDQGDTADQYPCRILVGEPAERTVAWRAPKIAMVPSPDIDPIAGVDRHATLHPPRVAFVEVDRSTAQAVSDIRILEDTVLVLDQRSYSSAAQRMKTSAIIKMLDQRPGFEITDVASFGDGIQLQDSIHRVYDQTQDVMHRERAAFAATDALDPDLIRDDAELAWRYLREFANPDTGLIPSTAFKVERETTTYDYATMWDIGSQIFGMIAAVELDLTTPAEMTVWAERLINGLPTVTIQGLRLPSSMVHTGGVEAPDQSFTTCDVGRLLNALDRLRTFSPALKGMIDSKVGNWDLQETIHAGRVQDLTDRLIEDRFISHCTQYSARGYAAFGIAADSPYAPMDKPLDADALIALLLSAADIGSIGAEPLLLEAVELGFTPTSKHLADMLFAAQLEDNRKTGNMRCVSESPLEQAPWFTYQGYSINNFEDPWNVQVRSGDEQYARPEFLRSIELISVKAAYLWAATYRHSYSDALVDYVRSRARIETMGFASGIYLETGNAMSNYSDLNTNAIILEAAASMLK